MRSWAYLALVLLECFSVWVYCIDYSIESAVFAQAALRCAHLTTCRALLLSVTKALSDTIGTETMQTLHMHASISLYVRCENREQWLYVFSGHGVVE
jgi:hypothetical protein